jgi:hypothetical protein
MPQHRDVNHPSTTVALSALARDDEEIFAAYARHVAVDLGQPMADVCDMLRACDVLEGLFAPAIDHDGDPRVPITNSKTKRAA